MSIRFLSEQDFLNARQTLALVRGQMSSGRIETDYILRQLDKIGALLENAENLQKAHKSAERFEALYNVSRLLGSSLDETTVLNQVMDAVIQLTGAERGFLMLRDDDGNLRVRVARNFDQQSISEDELHFSRTIAYGVMDGDKAILTTNAVEDPRFANQASIVSQALKSIMCVPLRARGQVIGVAYVENRVIAGLFADDDLATLEALAGQASMAIDNARLFSATDEQLNQRLNELRELRRIDLKLSAKLDFDEALRTTLESACEIVKARSGLIVRQEDGTPPRSSLICSYGQALDLAFYQDVVLQALQQGRTVRSADQQVMAVLLQRDGQDRTVLVLADQEHERFNDEHQDLVERVAVRALVTLENARLYRAVKAADQAKSEFVGIVAHDLKTPMTSIRGYADLVLMESEGKNLSPQQSKFLNHIISTVERMRVLVSDLADVSRIESGHFSMDNRPVSARAVIEAVRDTTMPEIVARQHHYEEDVPEVLPELFTDYYRLVQVMTNLVSNAYKYTPPGGTITLRVRPQGDRVRFEISDTGIGLSPEQIAKLGTKFWRADDDYTRSQSGTGLGFAITSSLVRLMGSTIEIDSQKGRGSTFAFSVPTYRPE
ncbi:MAG: GAF domain-containing sensor histidine kinase [Anaerolineae bacterium]|nr:GAF domain-containing sensor histidine kinase [Anaerolineae bacterium]MDW8174016.1 GAF domain-containing sensor histidine kinase [Anaerolineae bacterium]